MTGAVWLFEAAGPGVPTMYVAATGVRAGSAAAIIALALAGAASMGIMVMVNFMIRSAFRWLLSGVAALWGSATVVAVGVAVR